MAGVTLGALVLLAAIADTILAVLYGFDGTISWWIWTQSHHWPPIPFVAGVLVGHLFFSQPHELEDEYEILMEEDPSKQPSQPSQKE